MMPTGFDPSRAREAIREQAQTKDVEGIIAAVEEGVARFAAAAGRLPAERMDVVMPASEWTPQDCIEHLVSWDVRIAVEVLHVALTGALPESSAPTQPGGREGLLAQQREALDSLYAHVREASPDAFLDFTWDHPIFGPLNWREWLYFLRLHARDHAAQLSAAVDAWGGP